MDFRHHNQMDCLHSRLPRDRLLKQRIIRLIIYVSYEELLHFVAKLLTKWCHVNVLEQCTAREKSFEVNHMIITTCKLGAKHRFSKKKKEDERCIEALKTHHVLPAWYLHNLTFCKLTLPNGTSYTYFWSNPDWEIRSLSPPPAHFTLALVLSKRLHLQYNGLKLCLMTWSSVLQFEF